MTKLIEISLTKPLWVIVAVSLLVHLPGITHPLLDYHAYRQCQTASMARNYVRHGMQFLSPELDTEGMPARAGTEFPIYSYLLAILFKVFGTHDILGRLLSMVFAAWGAVFLYLFVRPRLGELTALWSGLVISVIPIHIYFTRSVQPEPMALWGLLGFLYYFDRFLNRGGTPWNLLWAVLLGALAPLLKLPFLYIVFPLWLYLGWERYRRDVWKQPNMTGSILVMLAMTAAWYHYAKSAPVGVLPLSVQEHWNNIRPIFTAKLWMNHFISRLPELNTTYTGLLLAGFGAYRLRQEGRLRMWAVWFGATALYIVLLGSYGLIHRYTELPFAPITAVFIASGIVWVWEKAHPHPQPLSPGERVAEGRVRARRWEVLLCLLIIGIPIHAGFRIAHWYQLEYPWVFRARAVVAAASRPDELLITQTREHPVLLYHLNRYGFSPDLEETGLGVIAQYRAKGARFFLTPTQENWQNHPEWTAYFAKNARLIYQDPDFLLYNLP